MDHLRAMTLDFYQVGHVSHAKAKMLLLFSIHNIRDALTAKINSLMANKEADLLRKLKHANIISSNTETQ